MATSITSESTPEEIGTGEDQTSTVAEVRSTDPSDVNNSVNGFGLSKCNSPKETLAVIYTPNIGYGLPLNIYLSNKAAYGVDTEKTLGCETFTARTSDNRAHYSFVKRNLSYSEQDAGESEKLISAMLDAEDDSITIDVERVFQPRNIESKHFATSVKLNTPCSKKYTFQQDLELPTPIFVKDVINDANKQPYQSFFDMPASPFGVDTFSYVGAESYYLSSDDGSEVTKIEEEYGGDILSRTKKSSHMPIRRGEGVLGDIYSHFIAKSGEFDSSLSDATAAYCLLGHELIESMKGEMTMKGTITPGNISLDGQTGYFLPYNDLQLAGMKGYGSSYPKELTSVKTVLLLDEVEKDTDGNVTSASFITHPMNEFYFYAQCDDTRKYNTQPSILTQFTGGIDGASGKDVLRFTTPSIFINATDGTGNTTRFYTSDEFTRSVFSTIKIIGSDAPPKIQTAGFSQVVVEEGTFATDKLIAELKTTKEYKIGVPGSEYSEHSKEFIDAYDGFIELLKGTNSEQFPEIATFNTLTKTDLSWVYKNNDILQEALYGTTTIENFANGGYTPNSTITTIADGLTDDGGVCKAALSFINFDNVSTEHADITTRTALGLKTYTQSLAYIILKTFPVLEKFGEVVSTFSENDFAFPSSEADSTKIAQRVADAAREIDDAISEANSALSSNGISAADIRNVYSKESGSLSLNVMNLISENVTIDVEKVDKISTDLSLALSLLENPAEDSEVGIGSVYLSDVETVSDSRSLISAGNRYYYGTDVATTDISIIPGTGSDLEVDETSISIPLNFAMTAKAKEEITSETEEGTGDIFITGEAFTGKNFLATDKDTYVVDLRNNIVSAMTADRVAECLPSKDRDTLTNIANRLNSIVYAITEKTFFVPEGNPTEYTEDEIGSYMSGTRPELVHAIGVASQKLKYAMDELEHVDKEGTISYKKPGNLFSDVLTPMENMPLSENVIAALTMYNKDAGILFDPLEDADVVADMASSPELYQQAMYGSFRFNMVSLIKPVLDEVAPIISGKLVFQGDSDYFINQIETSYDNLSTKVITPYCNMIKDAIRVAMIYLTSLEIILAIGDRLMLEALFSNESILLPTELGGNYGGYYSIAPKQLYNLHIFHFMTEDKKPIYPIVETDGEGTYPTLDGKVGFRDITSLCSYEDTPNRGLYYKLTMESPYYNEGEFKMDPVIFTGLNMNTGFWNCFADGLPGESDESSFIYSEKQYCPLTMIADKDGITDRLAEDENYNTYVVDLLRKVEGPDYTALLKHSLSTLWNEPTNKLDSPVLIEAKIEGKLNVSSAIGSSMRISVTAKDTTTPIEQTFKTDQPSPANFPWFTDTAFMDNLKTILGSATTFTDSPATEQYKSVMAQIHSEKMLTYLLWNSLGKTDEYYTKSVFVTGTTSYTINSKIATTIAKPINGSFKAGCDSLFVIPILGIILSEMESSLPDTVRNYISAMVPERFAQDPLVFVPNTGMKHYVAQKLAALMNYNQSLSLNRSLYSGLNIIDNYPSPASLKDVMKSGKISVETYDETAAEKAQVSYAVTCLCVGCSGLFSPAFIKGNDADTYGKKQQTINAVPGSFTKTPEYGFPLGTLTTKDVLPKNTEKIVLSGKMQISSAKSILLPDIAEGTVICPDEYTGDTDSFGPYNISPSFSSNATADVAIGRIYLNHMIGFLVLNMLQAEGSLVTPNNPATEYHVVDKNGIRATIKFGADLIASDESTGVSLITIEFPVPEDDDAELYKTFHAAISGKEDVIAAEIGSIVNNAASSGKLSTVNDNVGEYKQAISSQVERAMNVLINAAIAGTNSSVAYYVTTRKLCPTFSDGEATAPST